MNDRRQIVSDYLSRGWVPFAYSGQFTPPSGWQRSTVTDNTLNEVANASTPVAILLGKVSGIVVIDIDQRNGGNVRSFMEHYGLEPKSTRVHRSASPGSYHMFFKFPGELDELPKTKGERTGIPALTGVDMLADGSHILAPPTVRVGHPDKPDGEYELAVDVPIMEMPDALLVDWLSATTRQTPEGKAVGQINPNDYDRVLALHKRNIEIAANAVPGTRDDVCVSRIGSSIRIAQAMPDVVLSVEKVKEDFLNGVPYEIKDLDGKLSRAVEWAEQHAWKELVAPEGTLPDGVPAERAGEFFDELNKLRVREAAKRTFRMEELERETSYMEIGPVMKGSEFLKDQPPAPEWIVEGLIHYGGSALLTGKYKSGKSTLMLNLIGALTTGGVFLGKFGVSKPKTVAYIDMELGESMAWRWLKDLPRINTDRLLYLPRVGQGNQLNMKSETLRANTARMLRENRVDVLILDPLSPVMSALGIDENSADTVRPLLDSFDMLKAEANLEAIVVSHHTGHQDPSRARGSTAFMDWASSFLSVVRQGEEYDSPRTFRASGRDVAVNTAELMFKSQHRELILTGSGLYVPDANPF